MSLKETIGSSEVLNLGGTRAGMGFSYQHHWSIKKLIDLQVSGKDYVILFEVYDDVSILDSESDPKKIGIFQVKTSQHQRPVTLSKLCQNESSKPSILGKLLLVKKGLPPELSDAVDGLYVVSNSSYQNKTKFHSSVTGLVSVSEHYCDGLKAKIKNLSIETGFKENEVEDLLEITFLIKSPLSYDEPDRQIRDLLQEFFKNNFDNFDLNVNAFYDQLLREVENKCIAEKVDGYEETLKSKAITKSWFESVLRGISPDMKHKLKTVVGDLQREGWTGDKIILFERGWKQMEIDNLSDREYHNGKILETIEKLIFRFEAAHPKYTDIVEIILLELKSKNPDLCKGKNDYYIKALILWQTLEYKIKILEN